MRRGTKVSARAIAAGLLLTLTGGAAEAAQCAGIVPETMTPAELRATPLSVLERAAADCGTRLAAPGQAVDPEDAKLLQAAYDRIVQKLRLAARPAPRVVAPRAEPPPKAATPARRTVLARPFLPVRPILPSYLDRRIPEWL